MEDLAKSLETLLTEHSGKAWIVGVVHGEDEALKITTHVRGNKDSLGFIGNSLNEAITRQINELVASKAAEAAPIETTPAVEAPIETVEAPAVAQ